MWLEIPVVRSTFTDAVRSFIQDVVSLAVEGLIPDVVNLAGQGLIQEVVGFLNQQEPDSLSDGFLGRVGIDTHLSILLSGELHDVQVVGLAPLHSAQR